MRRVALLALLLALSPRSAVAQVNCTNNPGLCNLTVHSTIAQADLDVAIDIVLIGDGFLDVASWTVAADDAIARLLSGAAGYTTRVPGLINIHVVDVLSTTNQVGNADLTDTALGMNVSGSFINADASRVNLAALNAPDVDVVVTIANSGSGRANANYNTQLATGGVARLSRDVSPINHELGHALFHLADEYIEAGLCSGTPSEVSLILEANVTTDPACFKFADAPGAGCVEGGKYCGTGVFRSASGCMMRSSGGAPCPACDHEIADVLRERRSGRDLANPWMVAQAPAIATGMIDLFGRVHDDFFAGTVTTFEIDGTFVGTGSAFGQLRFDSTTLSDGPHSLVALGADLAGHTAASAPVTFTVDNALDTTAPVITIASPAAGALVSGRVGISVTSAANTRDITRIVVSIDGVPTAIAIDAANLFTQWLAPTSGSHRIDAVAVDRSGNVGLATAVTVTATTPRAPTRPVEVEIEAPRDGTAIGPYFALRWRGGEGEQAGGPISGGGAGSSTFDLVLDGALSGPLGASPRVIDASAWALGPHQLRVQMTTTTTVVVSAPVFVVRTAPTAPLVLISQPAGGAWLRGTVAVEVVAADDAPLASVSLTYDGAPIGSTTTVPGSIAWNTTLQMRGCGQLEAEVLSTDGGRARSPRVFVCVDNEAPVVTIIRPRAGEQVPLGAVGVLAQVTDFGPLIELRVDGVVRYTGGFFNAPTAALLADLTAGAHVLEVVATDQAGNVGTSPPVTITVVPACTAQSCDDGNTCTSDRCAPSGACLHIGTPGCCAGPADCDDGDRCSSDTCSNGMCQHGAIAGCCNQGFDCADQDACTQDLCVTGACMHPSAGCCAMASDCDDGVACTTDSCLGTNCAHDWVPGCCSVAADCDDGDACTANACMGGLCTSAPIAGCCRDATPCGDMDRCTSDICNAAHVCENVAIDGCCTDNADCTTLNPCATAVCGMRGQCEASAVAGCCNFDFECGDGVACTDDACAGNACRSVVSPICCSVPADCDDNDACTAEVCLASSRCSHTAIAGCCHVDGDCDDGDQCTREICGVGNVCQVASSTGCPDAGVADAAVDDDASVVIGDDAAVGLDVDPRADAAIAVPGADAAVVVPGADAAAVAIADAAAAGPPVEISGSCGCTSTDEGVPPGMLLLLVGFVVLSRRPRVR